MEEAVLASGLVTAQDSARESELGPETAMVLASRTVQVLMPVMATVQQDLSRRLHKGHTRSTRLLCVARH